MEDSCLLIISFTEANSKVKRKRQKEERAKIDGNSLSELLLVSVDEKMVFCVGVCVCM